MSEAASADTIRDAFEVAPGTIYLDAATYGLPPRDTVATMRQALTGWAQGTADWIADWDQPAESARDDFAALIEAPAVSVALLPSISVGVGLVAASLDPGDEVIVPGGEFTSVSYPFQVLERRGIRLRRVPIHELADAVSARTRLVAASLVQMQTGLRADVRAIREATDRVGARFLLDATQAIPFTRPQEDLGSVDYVLAHGYKHLLCPRGAAFLAVRDDRIDGLEPLDANWRAAASPYADYFNDQLSLGDGARQFDVSLAWLSWVGARTSLGLLRRWKGEGHLATVWQLADQLSMAAGLGAAVSTLVCVPVVDPDRATAALGAAGIRASVRGGAVRLSVHVWNDPTDIDRALEALAPSR